MRVGSRSHTAAAVMEVALADTLTSMGFERRSATNFLLDCGTHSWRVVFSGEVNDVPMSFREGTGCYVPELERLWKEYRPDGGPLAQPLRGMRHRVHTGLHIDDSYDGDQDTKWYQWARWRDNLSGWERLKRRWQSIPEPDFSYFTQHHPWYFQPNPHAFTCVTAKDIGVEPLGHLINRFWVALIKPCVEEGRTLRGYADQFYPTKSGTPLSSDFMMLWIAGDKDRFYAETEKIFEDEKIRIRQIYNHYTKGIRGRHDLIFERERTLRWVKQEYRSNKRMARKMKKLMAFLGA